MRDVAAATSRRINTELTQVMLGVQTPSEAVTAIAARLGSDRRRGITIVRTELGRAYAHAGQARMAQARRSLPGLRKQWRRSGKTHERPGHVAMDGQIRDVDEPYQTPDGVELLYPRDGARMERRGARGAALGGDRPHASAIPRARTGGLAAGAADRG